MWNRNRLILIFSFLAVFDIFVWSLVIWSGPNKNSEFYFLDVGQGDSELVILKGGVKVLIDGGPNNKVLNELSSVLRPTDRYLDLVILSHPQMDHMAGIIDVLKTYNIGLFINNGENPGTAIFRELETVVKQNNIKNLALFSGDKINYEDNKFEILSPEENPLKPDPNEDGLVIKLTSRELKTLFTADIGFKTENSLIKEYGDDLDIDILKVGHHGSKYSSGDNFLKITTPKVSVIEVGKNSYGHPTKETLVRLASVDSQIFRTDNNGTVKIISENGEISVLTRR